MLGSDRILIWEFASAPAELQELHHGPAMRWLMYVPKAIHGKDLDDLLVAQNGAFPLFRYEAANGDVVYTGAGPLVQALAVLSPAQNRAKFTN